MKKLLIILPLLTLLLSCNNQEINRIRTIDLYSGALTEIENVLFDTIVSELEYVVLETTSECLVSHVGGITITDHEILVMGRSKILVFDRKGNFISQLGSTGKGPEEYNSPLSILYNDKTGIYTIDDYKHILQFDKNHDFIRKIKKPDNLKRIHQLKPDLFVAERRVEPFFGDSIVYSLEFFDADFNTIMKHPSPEPSDPVKGNNFLVDLMGGITCSDKGLIFRETYGDTVYTVSGSMEVKPLLVIDYGPEKWKKEFNFDFGLFNENVRQYLMPGQFVHKNNILLSQFSLFGNGTYAITDITSNKTYKAYNTEADKNSFVLSAFPGFSFRPLFIEDYLSNVIQATEAIKYFDPDTEALPEDVKDKIMNLTEDDNPVLVFGKL